MTFQKKILSWYHKNKVEFPWRLTNDPYKIWVSEIMLQQTQVTTVIPFYNNWIQKFPTLNDVANASDDDDNKGSRLPSSSKVNNSFAILLPYIERILSSEELFDVVCTSAILFLFDAFKFLHVKPTPLSP